MGVAGSYFELKCCYEKLRTLLEGMQVFPGALWA